MLLNFVRNSISRDRLNLTSSDEICLLSPLTFDPSIVEVFCAFACSCTLVCKSSRSMTPDRLLYHSRSTVTVVMVFRDLKNDDYFLVHTIASPVLLHHSSSISRRIRPSPHFMSRRRTLHHVLFDEDHYHSTTTHRRKHVRSHRDVVLGDDRCWGGGVNFVITFMDFSAISQLNYRLDVRCRRRAW